MRRPPRHFQRTALAVGAASGVLLTVIAFVGFRRIEEREIEARLERNASNRVAALRVSLARVEDDLAGLGSFLRVRRPDRVEFGAVASQLEKNHPDTQALEWIPRVPLAEREKFEIQNSGEGRGSFEITERSGEGAMERAHQRPVYYPVTLVEPLRGNERALGFDLGSDPKRQEALNRAIASHALSASVPVTLVQETEKQAGVLLFQPVIVEESERRGESASPTFLGFALGVYRIGDLLEGAMRPLAQDAIELTVFDRQAPEGKEILASWAGGRLSRTPLERTGRTPPISFDSTVRFADRTWTVRCLPLPGFVEGKRTWRPWLILGLGLLVTALLTGILMLGFRLAARESDRLFRVLLDRISLGALVLHERGTVLYCNDALLSIVHRNRAEMEGADFFETCIAENEREEARASFSARVRGEVPAGYEEREIVRKDEGAERRLVGWTTAVLPTEGGRLVAIGSDITDRHKALETQGFLGTLVAHMQEAVIAFGLDLKVQTWSPGAEALYGWTAGEVIGRCVVPFVRPGMRESKALHFVARLAKKGRDKQLLVQARKDGTAIVVEAEFAALHDRSGAVSSFLAVCRDITAQKQAEKALRHDVTKIEQAHQLLRKSDERLHLALESGAHVTWEFDVERGSFAEVDRWARLLGLPKEAVPRTLDEWRRFLHPEDSERAYSAFLACIEGRTEEYNARYRVPSGTRPWRWTLSHGRALSRDSSGRALVILGTRTDITEVEELNRRLLAANRLASVGTLAAGIAHEINNPLAWMKANVGLCQELLASPAHCETGSSGPQPKLGELVDELRQGIDRIAEVVKAMRSLGRPDRPQEAAPVDVREELLAAVQMAKNHLSQKAQLTLSVTEGLPRVSARTSELGRVFLNLLINAADAIPEGASAEHKIEVRAWAARGEVFVEVADTGSGFTDEVRQRMFDPFFTTKALGQGSGLGLSIARSIVDDAGGRIEAERGKERGAILRVVLPEIKATQPRPPEVPSIPGTLPSRRLRVLLIDDEELVRRSLARMLVRNYEVQLLSSAKEAVPLLERGERFDAILCDLMMSGMSGIDFYQTMEDRFPSILPRLAFLTGGAFGDRATRFLADHDVLVIPKPVDAAELQRAVQFLAAKNSVSEDVDPRERL